MGGLLSFMKDKNFYEIIGLPTCAKCGATVPPGKKLCWCCEHTPKLHPMDKQSCKSDACDLNLEVRK